MSASAWTSQFGPFGADEKPIPYDEIPATVALREGRPFHGNFRICSASGEHNDIAASAIPIVGPGGASGGIVIFWPIPPDDHPQEAVPVANRKGAQSE
jgi:hypothetical protein